jgi:hypothetical protein
LHQRTSAVEICGLHDRGHQRRFGSLPEDADDWSAYYQKIDKANADLRTTPRKREGMAIMQTGIDNVRLARALTNPGVVLINLKKLFPDE